MNAEHVKEISQVKKNLEEIRKNFVDSLTLIIKDLILSAYQNIISGQDISCLQQKEKIDLEKSKEKSYEIFLLNKEPFSFKNIK